MWYFGIRKCKDGQYLITEEFPRKGYSICGQIEAYSKKELLLLLNDLINIIKYKKIKKANSDKTWLSEQIKHRKSNKCQE
jgi:hypothetical protein